MQKTLFWSLISCWTCIVFIFIFSLTPFGYYFEKFTGIPPEYFAIGVLFGSFVISMIGLQGVRSGKTAFIGIFNLLINAGLFVWLICITLLNTLFGWIHI